MLKLTLITLVVLPLLASAAFTRRQSSYADEAEDEEPVIPYGFKYSVNEDDNVQMFREEQKSASGVVTGKYGYIDPNGHMRVIQYQAGPDGFNARGDIGPDEETAKLAKELIEEDQRDKQPFIQEWNEIASRRAAAANQWVADNQSSPRKPARNTNNWNQPRPAPKSRQRQATVEDRQPSAAKKVASTNTQTFFSANHGGPDGINYSYSF